MKITFERAALPAQHAAVLFVAADGELGEQGKKLDAKTGGSIKRAIAAGQFKGNKGDVLSLLVPAKTKLSRIVLVGIGKPSEAQRVVLENAGAAACAALMNAKETQATWLLDDFKGAVMPLPEATALAVHGAYLRAYRFDHYFSKKEGKPKPPTHLTVATVDPAATKKAYQTLAHIAEGVYFTRNLVTEPANILYPETFAERCKALTEWGVKVDILDQKRLEKLGMGSLLCVSQGSVRPPRVVTMHWQGGEKSAPPIALVGKGVTFDTGGISLKPGDGMWDMKYDMAGAGAVTGAMHAIAANKLPANVVGVIGLVENMPSGHATRPGDVVTSMSGKTIEVLNTDAEGRLVLADAVWYAQETFKPGVLVDLATLTGAIRVALGAEYAGLFANDDALADQLTKAGLAVDEKVWRFPMGEVYDRELNSDIADVKNIATGGPGAGSILGAQFVGRFIKKGVHWAHLDIASMAWAKADKGVTPKGASGYGVRLLYEFVKNKLAA